MDAAEVAELLDGPDCDIDIQMIEASDGFSLKVYRTDQERHLFLYKNASISRTCEFGTKNVCVRGMFWYFCTKILKMFLRSRITRTIGLEGGNTAPILHFFQKYMFCIYFTIIILW